MQQLVPNTLANGRFVLEREIGMGAMGIVYQALDRETDMRVALKVLRCVDMYNIKYFKREFRSLHDFVHPNLCSLMELFQYDEQWFFTMELLSGVDFLSYVRRSSVTIADGDDPSEGDLSEAEQIKSKDQANLISAGNAPHPARHYDEQRLRRCLVELCHGLVVLHGVGKVHRDIKPSNVMITKEDRLVLLDFGLIVEKGVLGQTDQDTLAGSAAYMAPEQVESSVIGPAADVYSVGVMLYEVLTGQLPFTGGPLKMILDKQMKTPIRAGEICSGLPSDLEQLTTDLLTKDPAKRPSAEQILNRLGVRKTYFTQSTVAATSGHTANSLFVGRKTELQRLQGAFDKTVSKKAYGGVVLEGVSGVGKSALAAQFSKLLLYSSPGAIVLEGGCYERESAPYKAFDGVIESIVRYLRRIPLEEGAKLVPRNASLLITLFPTLQRSALFANVQRSSDDVIEDALELRNRSFDAFKELLGLMSRKNPVVVVIDDMQWADADSLVLLRHLFNRQDTATVFFVLISRASENDEKPSWDWDEIASSNLERMKIYALGLTESEELARFHLNRERIKSPIDLDLEVISREADGHPLYIVELVRHVVRGGADWKNMRIEDVIWQRIVDLSLPARRLLRTLAVAGTPIQRRHLQDLVQMSSEELYHTLGMLRAAQLIRTRGSNRHHFVELYHDRVREAVVINDMTASETSQTHLELGRFFLKLFSDEELEENIFVVARHLFDGQEMMEDEDERKRLAQLLYRAGRKSRSQAAFVSSLVYFKESMNLFSPDAWETDYQTVFHLYCLAAETAYITGDFPLAKKLVEKTKRKARSLIDQAKIYEIYVLSLAAENRPQEAIDAAIGMIHRLGVYLPRRLSKIFLLWKIITTKIKLLGQPTHRLRDLPLLDNENVAAVCRLFNRVSHTVFLSMPSLRAIMVIRLVELSLRYGVDQNMAASFALWGFMNSTLLGDFGGGYKYGRLALDILKRFEKPGRSQLTLFTFATFLQHLRDPVGDSLPLLVESHKRAYETGDLPYYAWSGTIYCFHSFFAGEYLPGEVEKYAAYLEDIADKGQDVQYYSNCIVYQTALNLIETGESPTTLNGIAYNEDEMALRHLEKNQRNNYSSFLFFKLFLQLFFGEYKDAYHLALESDKYVDTRTGTMRDRMTPFYDSLVCLKYYDEVDAPTKKRLLVRVKKNQKKYHKIARSAPANHQHKFQLVEAERARIRGKTTVACGMYDNAIKGAEQNRFPQDAALAAETAAEYYVQLNWPEQSLSYAQDALFYYEKWGAFAKLYAARKKFQLLGLNV